MKINITSVDRVTRVVFGAVLLFAAYALFQNITARVLVALGGLLTLGEGLLGICGLHSRLGIRSIAEGVKKDPILGFLLVQLVFAFEWWGSGWEKLMSSDFAGGLAATLAAFASQNPFPWYKDFLTSFAIPNVQIFANLTMWGALLAAATLFATAAVYAYSKNKDVRRWMLAFALLALIGGLILNANYYLAAGWTGPGTRGVNLVMFWIQAALIYVYGSTLAKGNR